MSYFIVVVASVVASIATRCVIAGIRRLLRPRVPQLLRTDQIARAFMDDFVRVYMGR